MCQLTSKRSKCSSRSSSSCAKADDRIDAELSKVIIGQKEVTSQLLISLFAGGHCLITGAPGLAKTLLVRSLAQIFHLKFQRIQFTPDLMPADITGTEILEETAGGHRECSSSKGPIFANVILADEINRTPPKTQAALLEAMQEHQVTAGGVRYPLEEPFFVLATQNPIEMEGTYPAARGAARPLHVQRADRLPAGRRRSGRGRADHGRASRSRSSRSSPARTCGGSTRSCAKCRSPKTWSATPCDWPPPAAHGRRTRPTSSNKWVSWGAGLRAAQYLVLGAKARALLNGRSHVTLDDIQRARAPHVPAPHPGRLPRRSRRRHGGRRDRTTAGDGRDTCGSLTVCVTWRSGTV